MSSLTDGSSRPAWRAPESTRGCGSSRSPKPTTASPAPNAVATPSRTTTDPPGSEPDQTSRHLPCLPGGRTPPCGRVTNHQEDAMAAYADSIQKAPRTLTEREQKLLLRVTGEHRSGFRDHVIIATALGTGLRAHELLALDVGDVFDGDGRARRRVQLRVFKRSNDDVSVQEVILPNGLRAKLDKLWRWKRAEGQSLAADAPLFVSRNGNRLSGRQLRERSPSGRRRPDSTGGSPSTGCATRAAPTSTGPPRTCAWCSASPGTPASRARCATPTRPTKTWFGRCRICPAEGGQPVGDLPAGEK